MHSIVAILNKEIDLKIQQRKPKIVCESLQRNNNLKEPKPANHTSRMLGNKQHANSQPPCKNKASENGSAGPNAKKPKQSYEVIDGVTVHENVGHRLLSFDSVFSALSTLVKCKTCGGDISFGEANPKGLGFQLIVNCAKCSVKRINSCPLIEHQAKYVNQQYEVNARFVFSMRLLGIRGDGIEKFLGFVDLFPRPDHFFRCYDSIINDHILDMAGEACKSSMSKWAKVELEKSREAGADDGGTITW